MKRTPRRKTVVLQLCSLMACLMCLSGITDPRPAKVTDYLTKYRYLAVELNKQAQIPIPVIIAVAGLESDWGTSLLAQQSNNHFGLKAQNWIGQVHCQGSPEYIQERGFQIIESCFRKYPYIRDSYMDFGRYLSTDSRYYWLFYYHPTDYASWATGLQQSGYATDPDYSSKIIRLIQDYKLEEI